MQTYLSVYGKGFPPYANACTHRAVPVISFLITMYMPICQGTCDIILDKHREKHTVTQGKVCIKLKLF